MAQNEDERSPIYADLIYGWSPGRCENHLWNGWKELCSFPTRNSRPSARERGRMSADELGLSFATRKSSENKEEMQKSLIGASTLTVPKEARAFLDENSTTKKIPSKSSTAAEKNS